ncbi:flagellar motor protein MotB [Helicobacter himalayensis]|uniref:flagellar motor protein MotB n=1 Tax=Helicobacter himalayensis TaxID=1591088 RepID=UPI003D6E24B4
MAKKKKCPECPAGEKWAVPYADFLSLLLALFIALWAISSTDSEKVHALKEELIKIFDYPVAMPLPSPVDQDVGNYEGNDAEDSSSAASASTESTIPSDIINDIGGVLEQMDSGSVLRLPDRILFRAGEFEITNSDTFTYLDRLITIIKKYPNYVHLDIRGYTDDSTPPPRFRDNYEFSSARAVSVARELIQKGVEAHRISVSGYGSYDNVAPNDTPEQRAQNNRVEIYFFVSRVNSPKIKSMLERQGEN